MEDSICRAGSHHRGEEREQDWAEGVCDREASEESMVCSATLEAEVRLSEDQHPLRGQLCISWDPRGIE